MTINVNDNDDLVESNRSLNNWFSWYNDLVSCAWSDDDQMAKVK